MVGLSRLILHWTAGSYVVNDDILQHYHFAVDGSGTVHAGIFKPEDNIKLVGDQYAAHTYHCNTGSIGISVCAMGGAVQSPFNVGKYPIKIEQQDAFVALAAHLCDTYGIKVSRSTVLTHAEVQPTLGVKQKGKWDITWLPGMPQPGDPVEVGDILRRLIAAKMSTEVVDIPPTIKFGSTGSYVKRAQTILRACGYISVDIDGNFGIATETAMKWYQESRGLMVDGITGPKTWAMLLKEKV